MWSLLIHVLIVLKFIEYRISYQLAYWNGNIGDRDCNMDEYGEIEDYKQ